MFGAYAGRKDHKPALLSRMGVGEIIGEIGFITGEGRSATVKAVRNSEVLRFSRQDLERLAAKHPSILFEMCATVIRRLQSQQGSKTAASRPRVHCLVPHDLSLDLQSTARQIAGGLDPFGTVAVIAREDARGQTSHWFTTLETSFDYIILLAEPRATEWTRFCLRQCDCVLLVARGEAEASAFAALGPSAENIAPDVPRDLVLLWGAQIASARTSAWLRAVGPRLHHHVRSPRDARRAARLIAGRGIGLVLSGGGARGLAHVGVIAALREHGVPVDVVGGTSVGAVIAASVALEWNPSELAQSFVGEFANSRITDYAIPRVALFSERKLSRTLGRWFGDLRIEDAPLPFFCVSSNLTFGSPSVHRRGQFATWLRASSAIPGVFPPVIEDGAVHVDGGVLDNLPVTPMHEFGVESIIAVDVGSDSQSSWRYGDEHRIGDGSKAASPSMIELLWRVGTISSGAARDLAQDNVKLVVRPAVSDIGIFGWQASERAIEAGRIEIIKHLQEIRAFNKGIA